MKTIYYYGIDNNKAGMEKYALNLISNILTNSKEYKFHIISQYEDFAFKDIFVKKLKCDYTIIPKLKKHPFKYMKAIEKILSSSNKGDLFQLNIMSYRNFFLLHASKKARIKKVIVGHSSKSDNIIRLIFHKIFRKYYGKMGYKVADNNFAAAYMFGNNKNVQLIPFAIDKNNFVFDSKKREDFRREFSIKNDDVVIGQVGRISKQKNQIFTLKLIKQLQNKEKIKILMFGKEIKKSAKRYIKKHLIKNVKLAGEMDDMQKVYSGIDIFVFPSLYESTGFALHEALTNGCYCISSNNVPTQEINSNRLSVLKLSEKDWANCINETIICNTYKRNNSFQKIPSLENEVNEFMNLYNKLSK